MTDQTNLQTIYKLLQTLNAGELEAIQHACADLRYEILKAEKKKMQDIK